MRKELHNWEEKRRQVFIKHKPGSSTLVCGRERDLRGFIHNRFTVESDSVQLMCIEPRLKEKLKFERCADLGIDDGDDKMVTIMS